MKKMILLFALLAVFDILDARTKCTCDGKTGTNYWVVTYYTEGKCNDPSAGGGSCATIENRDQFGKITTFEVDYEYGVRKCYP